MYPYVWFGVYICVCCGCCWFFLNCFVSVCNDSRGKDLLGDSPLPRDEQTKDIGGICIWKDMFFF